MLPGPFRLVHPFPSALDAAVTFALALVAGATAGRAALLGVAMLTIQFSIGAFNDVLDAPADAVAGRSKPLVDGRIPARVALRVAGVAGTVGLVLAALAGPAAALVALTGYGIGLAYDLRLKASPWSWLPYAMGIPLCRSSHGWVRPGTCRCRSSRSPAWACSPARPSRSRTRWPVSYTHLTLPTNREV